MSMMTSQILKLVDFTKSPKSRYLESEPLFVLQIKNSLITHQGQMEKNSKVKKPRGAYLFFERNSDFIKKHGTKRLRFDKENLNDLSRLPWL